MRSVFEIRAFFSCCGLIGGEYCESSGTASYDTSLADDGIVNGLATDLILTYTSAQPGDWNLPAMWQNAAVPVAPAPWLWSWPWVASPIRAA